MTTDLETWFAGPERPSTEGKVLVCLPHAGGSASFFRDWAGRLPGVDVYAVRYPGRAERIDEPAPTDLPQLAAEIAEAACRLAHRPIALLGHSMGAAVALETARELERRGVRLAHLFASGSRDAALPEADPERPTEDPDAVADRLVSLGGTDPAIAADPMFRELVLPYVISDGRMFHAYAMRSEPVLRCPVTTIFGDRDDEADRRPWHSLTVGATREVQVSGNHFYLVEDPPFELLASVLATPDRPAEPTAPRATTPSPGPRGVSA